MKKILLILSLLILCSAFASAESLEHYFAVDDSSPAEDVILLTNVIQSLKSDLGENYVTRLNSEITKDNLDNRITLFIYKQSALIIVGEHSPSEHVVLATKISNLLKDNYGIDATSKTSGEITNDDLTKEIVIKPASKAHLFVTDDQSPASDVVLLTDVVNNVKSELDNNYETKLNSEVKRSDLNYRTTTFIYEGQALIIVGANSPSEHVILATKISNYLKNNKNIDTTQKLSSEITSDDLRKELPQKEKRKHYFITDDQSPASDVILLTNLVKRFEDDLDNNYETKLNSEVKRTDLNNRVSVFIYKNNALIIVGENSPSEHVILATDISNVLKKEYGITATTKISSEIKNDDLKKEIKIVYCTDTDGKDFYTKGKVTWTDPNIYDDGSYGKTSTYEDECESSTRLKEYICVDSNNFQSTETECSYGCANGICQPFYEEEEEIEIPEEEIESSVNCPPKSCKTVSEVCAGSDKIIKEECTVHIQKDGACEESTITNTKILKNACAEEEVTTIMVCQGCQIDESTCIPFGTRLEKKNVAYYCDISKKMTEQKQDKQSCQNSYECLSSNCKAGTCAPICDGCLDENNVCIPISTRTETQYCDIDYSFKNQKSEDMNCNNNYECSTNICVNNKCISPSFIQKIMDWFSKLFGG